MDAAMANTCRVESVQSKGTVGGGRRGGTGGFIPVGGKGLGEGVGRGGKGGGGGGTWGGVEVVGTAAFEGDGGVTG